MLLVVLGIPTVLVALVEYYSPSPIAFGTNLWWIRKDLYDAISPLGGSLEAIASAGLHGRGWGQGLVSHFLDSLHQPVLGFDRAASMAFTVFTEELDVVGAVVLIVLVLALSLRGLQIAASIATARAGIPHRPVGRMIG